MASTTKLIQFEFNLCSRNPKFVTRRYFDIICPINMLNDDDRRVISNEINQKKIFSNGINVNFVSIKNNKIFLIVHERGVGFTLACGSGACASFAALNKLGIIKEMDDHSTIINFPRGELIMNSDSDGNIIMSGPADYSFNGEYYI